MSENNREGKRAARERLQEMREREQAREKRKRALTVGAVAVAVLGVAAAVGVIVANTDGGEGSTSTDGPVVPPAGGTGTDGLIIPVGKADAPSTLAVFEDFRCPACAQFEGAYRDTVHELENKGLLRTEYHLATIIDGNLGGSGSLKAANAAACAQDAGKFPAYHDELFRNQPPETDDAFANTRRLINIAEKVDGLVTDTFRGCVENGTHNSWVKKSNQAFRDAGHSGTPTVLLNGKNIYADQNNPLTPEKLKQEVEKAAAAKR
ncbi:DsbA family protein [Streptomyces sp. URMC 123]|uniref:DsbA family protein n=1 Tax=Streptomyces sp. URMC 123 TaxID=3423403 RepID=UPI003F1C3933